MNLIVSDDHLGLKAARKAALPTVPWQRCLFHFAQNAMAYVPKVGMRKEIAQSVRDIFNCSSFAEAKIKLNVVIKNYEKSCPKLTEWLENNAHEAMTFYRFERTSWRKIRSINYLERLNREIKRRTKVASIFPNEASLLRPVTAIVMEQHEEWVSGRKYLGDDPLPDKDGNRIYEAEIFGIQM